MAIDWEPLRTIFEQNERFVLSSHVRPDGDALGSELAVAGILEGLGKSVRIVNPSEKPEHLKFLDPSNKAVKLGKGVDAAQVADTDVHLILDTSAWNQLSDVGKAFQKSSATKVVIDHHVSADDLGAIEFKDTQAEATGAIVFRMAESLGYPLDKEIAIALFCAIATDTGWFRFSSTSSDTMRIAGELIDLGVEPHVLYRQLYEQHSLARVKLAGRVLGRVTVKCDGRLAFTSVEQQDFAATGAKPADTEDLVNECLRIGGVECAFIAVEQQNGGVKVSFRSRTNVNVALVAEQFGGGGHKQAAGAVLPGPLSAALTKVVAAMTTGIHNQ